MKRSKEFKQMDVTTLESEHIELLNEQFKLKMQQGSAQAVKSHLIKQNRQNIARVLTILGEKKREKHHE